jgi:hypothetical protein
MREREDDAPKSDRCDVGELAQNIHAVDVEQERMRSSRLYARGPHPTPHPAVGAVAQGEVVVAFDHRRTPRNAPIDRCDRIGTEVDEIAAAQDRISGREHSERRSVGVEI